MDKSEKIKVDFSRIALAVQRSVEADQLWRTLGDSNNHEEYRTQYEIYIPFFESVRDLALCQLITNIARVNDRAKGALSLERLIERLENSDFKRNEIQNVKTRYDSNSENWGKIKTLRDKCIVHSAAELSEKQIFESVGIQNDGISDSVALAREIMVSIGAIIGAQNTVLARTDWAVRDDCNKLLKNLKSGRSAKLRELCQHEYT